MRTLILAVLITAAVAAVAAPLPYDQCREIVAQHTFMIEGRKGCPTVRLREDTSNLAYSCTTRLSAFHRDLAIRIGRETAERYRATNGDNTCSKLRDDFYPLIKD